VNREILYHPAMRSWVAVMLVALACKGSKVDEAPNPPAAAVATPAAAPGDHGSAAHALALDHDTLLQPEAVVAGRSDADSLVDLMKRTSATIIAHDRGLPDELDALVAARAGANRVWLTSAAGDIAAPALETELAKLAPISIRAGTVIAVLRMVRAGATASKAEAFLPGVWKAAAGAGDSSIDAVIDRVWPPR